MIIEEQAATEAALAASQQTPEQIVAAEAAMAAAEKRIYTADELAVLTPTDIDIGRVAPEVRSIVENTIRDYKHLQADHTRKSQELAELRKKGEETETYFEDKAKDGVFKDYLKSPTKILSDINSQIAVLESIIPDDGVDDYRKARRDIAYWQGIKDEFSFKRMEISEKQRQEEIAEVNLRGELGENVAVLLEYAQSLGFTIHDFKTKPKVREAVKSAYDINNATNTARTKEVKPKPQRTAASSGDLGGGGNGDDEEKILMNPDTPTSVRMAIWKRRRK